MNKVKIFLFLGGLGTGILAPYAYNSLKNVFKSATQNNELVSRARYSPWISAHTSGMLLSESAVMVRFNQSPAEEIRNKISEDPGKFLDFSPSFKFKAEWQDDKTLRIIPEEPMKHGEKINCTLELSSIFKGVPDDCEEFEFAYSVVPKKLKFQAGVPEINEDGTAYDFSGTIYSSDKIKPDELYPLLTANEKLNITWSHEPDGRTHRFVINGIPRTNFDRVIQLTLKDWGSDEKYTFDLLVPRKNHFALISADIPANRDDAVLRMVFSDALSNKVPAESFVVPESALLKFNYVLQNNVLLIFPENIYDKKVKFTVFKNLKNIFGQNFGKDTILYFDIPDARPSVSFADKGNIIPPASEKEDILIPFESVNLKAVDVEIFKIFQDNLVSFFLFNNWDDNSNLTYYGKKVLSKTIPLNIINPADYKIKTRHFLNLKELIKTDPGCIYRVVLKFKKKYSACNCIGASDVYEASIQQLKADESEDAEFYAYYSDIDNTYYDEDEPYSWEQAKNPCHSSYYDGYNTMKARNFLVSNIGLTVKRTPGKKYHVFANDLNTTEPLKNVSIEAYSLQRKLLGTNTTDGDGHAEFNSPEPVALIVATKGHLKNYIRLDEYSLGTSMFEAGGNNSKKGAKVFLYTERGVWRPGDTVFLGVMTHARDKNYFNGLPVHLELLNPTGNVVYRVSKEYSENGLYTFAVPLPENAQLGFWSARVHAGPVTQSKTLRVDAIVPNRLKILAKTDRDDYIEVYRQHNLSIHAQWLAGAKASGLNYDIEYYLTSNNEGFEKFPGFCFSNLTLPAFQYSLSLGSGRLDEEGNTVWPFQINLNDKVPGMLNCLFKIRVFEGGGGFSSDAFSVKASPFTSYAGFKLPFNPNNNAYQYLECGKSHLIQLASVWPDGKPKPNSSLIFTLHKLEWRWWWEKNQYGDAEYHSDTYLEPVASYTVKTNANGQAMQKLDFSNEEWGRYLISVRDPESGHVASREVYVDWANWTSRFSEGNQMSEIVYLKLDKDRYRVGDKAHVYVPAPDNAKVLLTVENSNGIISSEWVTAANAKDYVINITPEMFPNAYVYVSIIQPRTRSNNLPMRLYGLARLQADDPDAVLQPVLKMPDVLKPGQKVNLSISEKNGKEMEVTVAMVDEGLLDLTKFKTPDPLAYFSAVEAYVNRTWDHYSRVLGSFNADIQRILNVGGDMEMMSDDGSGVKRFKPMVRFVGPIKVKKGENKELSVQLPPYIGSLRTMVVAKGDAKFGSTEKTTPVKSDLMILGQAPRFCSMGDEFDVPVWVFTGSKPMKNIKLNIILQGNGKSTGNSEILCSLNAESQELKTFRVKATEEGSMKITVRAEYGNEKSEWSIDLPVILATPVERKTENFSVDAGKSFKKTLTFFGTSHQSTVQAEWTGISPIPFAYWMKQVKEYPYACAEQLSSNAISLMALSEILMLDKKQHTELVSRILHTQQQLNFYLTAEGGLGYWPGASATDPWISAYVLYFLKWCEWKNITVYSNLKSKLLQYNKTQSKLWYTDAKTLSSCAYSMQAFRLWVLSLFNEVDIASMNALARQAPSDALSAYFLALAYYQSGFHTMAKQQIKKYASQGVRPKADREYCYNSDLQAMAMELSYHVLTGNEQKALEVYNLLAKRINFDNWVSSFELAFGLSACVAYLKKFGGQGNVQFKALWDNQTTQAEGNVFAWSKSKILQKNGSVNFELQNTGKQKLNGTLTWFGKNKPGMETPASNGFNLDFDMNGGHQNLTGEKVLQGKDVYVNIRVTYTGSIQNLNHIALEIPLPAGWEWATTTTDLINAGGISGADYFELKDNKAVIYFNAISGNRYEFSLRATASYSGKFYWPSPRVMAMDNPEYYIYGKGSYIEVKENTPGENF